MNKSISIKILHLITWLLVLSCSSNSPINKQDALQLIATTNFAKLEKEASHLDSLGCFLNEGNSIQMDSGTDNSVLRRIMVDLQINSICRIDSTIQYRMQNCSPISDGYGLLNHQINTDFDEFKKRYDRVVPVNDRYSIFIEDAY